MHDRDDLLALVAAIPGGSRASARCARCDSPTRGSARGSCGTSRGPRCSEATIGRARTSTWSTAIRPIRARTPRARDPRTTSGGASRPRGRWCRRSGERSRRDRRRPARRSRRRRWPTRSCVARAARRWRRRPRGGDRRRRRRAGPAGCCRSRAPKGSCLGEHHGPPRAGQGGREERWELPSRRADDRRALCRARARALDPGAENLFSRLRGEVAYAGLGDVRW